MIFFLSQWLFPIVIVSLQFWALVCVILIPRALPRANCSLPLSGRTNQMSLFYRITDAHIRWCRIANPTQLKRCPYGQE